MNGERTMIREKVLRNVISVERRGIKVINILINHKFDFFKEGKQMLSRTR